MSALPPKATGASQLRAIVRAMANEPESFLDAYTLPQLVALYTAAARASWTYAPSTWTDRQRREALRGVVPRWDAEGRRAEYAPRARRAAAPKKGARK